MKWIFLSGWVISNMIGYSIANYVGNSVWGLVVGFRGDVLSGLVSSVFQTLALIRFPILTDRRAALWWIPATVLGFTIGANFAKRLTPFEELSQISPILVGIVFGLIIGVPISITQWIVLRQRIMKKSAVSSWLIVSMAAWIVGEVSASLLGNIPVMMAVFGLIYAAITGVFFFFQWPVAREFAVTSDS